MKSHDADTTTHVCPVCGDVHLPPSVDAQVITVPKQRDTNARVFDPVPGPRPVSAKPEEHAHESERRPYSDLAGHPVYLCITCGARVTAEGGEWKPRGTYPW